MSTPQLLTTTLVLCLLLSPLPARAAIAPELAPLDIRSPAPVTGPTPMDVPKLPNLEKPATAPRPPFLAPVGCENLALKRPVTGSDSEPLFGNLAMVTDGDKAGNEGSWVELGPGKQWVQIDLGRSAEIYAVVFWHMFSEIVVYKGVVVQVSDDPDFVTGIQSIYNGDIDNSVGQGIGRDPAYQETNQGRLVDARGVKARYVRLWSCGSTRSDNNHYTEVEVWGR
jgi:hypothetical protein